MPRAIRKGVHDRESELCSIKNQSLLVVEERERAEEATILCGLIASPSYVIAAPPRPEAVDVQLLRSLLPRQPER